MSPPRVSVIIVTYNSTERVRRCVDAVLASTESPLQVIVVDNGSSDGTVADLRAHFWDQIEIVALPDNIGPAAARNQATRRARGRYLAFLDNDTVPRCDWLDAPLLRLESDLSIGACQCKLLLLSDPGAFDYAGDYLSPLGFLIQRVAAGDRDRGQADEPVELFSAKSAGMVMRRAAFRQAGGFDPDYFIYVEETDLAWRVWLQGYRIVFEPRSEVLHEFGTSAVVLGPRQNVLLKYHGTRNYLTTIFKCAGFPSVLPMLTLNLLGWLGLAGWLGLRGCFQDAFHILRGVGAFALRLGENLAKRRLVQGARRVRDVDLYPRILRRRGFRYFYDKVARPHRVGNAPSYHRPKESRVEQAVS